MALSPHVRFKEICSQMGSAAAIIAEQDVNDLDVQSLRNAAVQAHQAANSIFYLIGQLDTERKMNDKK